MGHVSHHAIIVTGCIDGLVAQAHEAACLAGLMPTEVTHAQVNGYESFMVPPVGSKEGWPPAVESESQRARFKAELRAPPFVYDDGSSGVSWVEVHFDRYDETCATINDGDTRNRPADDELGLARQALDDMALVAQSVTGSQAKVNAAYDRLVARGLIDPLHWDQRDLDDAAAILKADQDRLAQQEPTTKEREPIATAVGADLDSWGEGCGEPRGGLDDATYRAVLQLTLGEPTKVAVAITNSDVEVAPDLRET